MQPPVTATLLRAGWHVLAPGCPSERGTYNAEASLHMPAWAGDVFAEKKIPSDLRKRLASSEICIRIGVIATIDAEQIGRRLAVETDLFIENARVDPMIDDAALRQFVTATISDWKINQEQQTAQLQKDFGRATGMSARKSGAHSV